MRRTRFMAEGVSVRMADAHAAARPPRGHRIERYGIALAGAILVVLVLFSLVQQLIRVPTHALSSAPTVVRDVHVLNQPPPPQHLRLTLPAMPTAAHAKAPPGPPMAPHRAVPGLPSKTIAPAAAPALESLAAVGVPVDVGTSANLFGVGKFAGFAGGAAGAGGGGGGGNGSGAGFNGKLLIPLSTARPEIPKWAFDHKIEGWVEVQFTVNTDGHVGNIRIVDAQPKGVFEAAAVKSIAHWIYPEQKHSIQVRQRVQFRLKDYKYNWTTG